MKIKYKPMHVYKLHRSDGLDHEYGRPAIFLDFLGQESLVWFGTSTKVDNKEKSFTMIMNGVASYFYNKGLTKVNTNHLVGKWHNNKTHKIISLDDSQQKALIVKFSSLTLQINPYSEINILKMKIKLLEKQIKQEKEQQGHGI